MFPEVTDIIRDTIQFRYQLIPYIYSLFVQYQKNGDPIIRPLLYQFTDPNCLTESFDYMFGPSMLVASIFKPNVRSRQVYLPKDKKYWYNFHTSQVYRGGETVTVEAPLEYIPLLIPEGSIIPACKKKTPFSNEKEERIVYLFPLKETGKISYQWQEDDGVSLNYLNGEILEITIVMESTPSTIQLQLFKSGTYQPEFKEINFIFPSDEEREIIFQMKVLEKFKSSDRSCAKCEL